MQIVDAQIHLWGTGLPSIPVHRQVTHFTPDEAIVLMDEAGVNAAVISPPPWDPRSTELAIGGVKNYPGRFAIMGSVPFDPPKSRGRIASWRDQPGMLGLRFGFIGDRERQRVQDGSLEWLWTAAENNSVPLSVMATDTLRDLGQVAERHPGFARWVKREERNGNENRGDDRADPPGQPTRPGGVSH